MQHISHIKSKHPNESLKIFCNRLKLIKITSSKIPKDQVEQRGNPYGLSAAPEKSLWIKCSSII